MRGAQGFRAAVEARDHGAMMATLSDDVVFRSPVTFKPFEGRETVGTVLAAVLRMFDAFEYTDELTTNRLHALVFRARVGDREVEGVDLLRLRDDGQIHEITVLVRPFRALEAVRDAMGRELGVLPRE